MQEITIFNNFFMKYYAFLKCPYFFALPDEECCCLCNMWLLTCSEGIKEITLKGNNTLAKKDV